MPLGRRIVSVDLVLVNHALVVASRRRRPSGASAGFVNAMHRILIALVVAGVTPMLFFSGVDAEPGEVATQELRLEEINDGIAGSNYGWPATEGSTTNPNFRSPLFAYGHGTGPTTGCAIAGGAFYRSAAPLFPADFVGDYFFADLCSGWIRRFDPASGMVTDFASGFSAPVDLQVGTDGGLYVLSRGVGAVHVIRFGNV